MESSSLGGVAFTILSCTSQAEAHPAAAVKSPTTATYWQTQGPEKKATLELSLSTPVQLKEIVIGNAGAAFVEVLVGKSTSRPVDYQVLQPIKPLCTRSESKSGRNRYGGYSFGDKFERNVAKQTWDRVKIVCTQPWNVGALGLSFVIINPTSDVSHLLKPDKGAETLSAAPKETVSPITPATGTEEEEENKERRKDQDEVPFNELLAGVTFVISGIQNPERAKLRDRATKMGAKYQANWDNRSTHLICAFKDTPKYREVKEKGGIVVKPKWINDCYSQMARLPLTEYSFEKESRSRDYHDQAGTDAAKERNQAKSQPVVPQPTKTDEEDSGTEEMEDIAGIFIPDEEDMIPTLPLGSADDEPNPCVSIHHKDAKVEAGNDDAGGDTEKIDDSDVDMYPTLPIDGYEAHSKEQPKQTQKPSSSTIQTKANQCEPNDEKPTWKDNDADSDTEEMEDDLLPTIAIDLTEPERVTVRKRENETSGDKNEEPSDTGVVSESRKKTKQDKDVPSSRTTSKAKGDSQEKKDKVTNKKKTEASQLLGKQYPLHPLPEFLDGVNVFFYGKTLEPDLRRLLSRYIKAYKGQVYQYLYSNVTHVVTTEKWGKEFDNALKSNPELVIVQPEWVMACHIQQKRVETSQYSINKLG